MKLKGEQVYFFCIPLQEIIISELSISIPEQYCFCSLYYPSKLQDSEDFMYLVKVYDFFSSYVKEDIGKLEHTNLLFGESRFLPFIPNRGEMKWLLIGKKKQERDLEIFPDFKLSSLDTFCKPQDRNWFLLKHAGLSGENYFRSPRSYEEIRDLELGDEMSEVSLKFRVYIEILKRAILEKGVQLTIDAWKDIMLNIIVKEPATKKTSVEIIKNEFIESYIFDYLDVWSFSEWCDFR